MTWYNQQKLKGHEQWKKGGHIIDEERMKMESRIVSSWVNVKQQLRDHHVFNVHGIRYHQHVFLVFWLSQSTVVIQVVSKYHWECLKIEHAPTWLSMSNGKIWEIAGFQGYHFFKHTQSFMLCWASIHPSIYLSIHPSIRPSIHRSIDPSIDPSIHLSIYLIYLCNII